MNYQIPNKEPWANSGSGNTLWIKITSYKYGSQSAAARGSTAAIRRGAPESVYQFIAPNDIQLNLDHSWDNYENITSRMANVISNYAIPMNDIKGIARNVNTDIASWFTAGSGKPGSTGLDTISGKLAGMMKGDVVNYRVDAPLVYKGSTNLEYNFNFDLALHNEDSSYIEKIVKSLMIESSPSKKENDFLSIQPPNIFKIETIPAGIVHLEYAALKVVQPELSYPYVKGKALICKLQLTFQDMSPLFRDTFDKGSSIVTVS